MLQLRSLQVVGRSWSNSATAATAATAATSQTLKCQDFYQASGLADRSGPGADEMKWQLGRDSAVPAF